MEKKGIRLVQPSTKGLTSDSKKSQDGATGKLWPRSGRRRELSGGSLAAKSESSRKTTPQRTPKIYDVKRPRPRGIFNPDSVVGGTETARLEEDLETEWDLVDRRGGKKTTLNYLLNFNYGSHTTRNVRGYYSDGGFANKNFNSNRSILTKKHKYNKEHFLQANCQFVVNSSGDYKQYMNNVDALVEWSLIEQVNVEVSDHPMCPICLYPPVAAKITRCGHSYCWHCILHYLSLAEKTWSKCPICDASIHKQDLKSVTSKLHKTFNVDDVITFKLMKRAKNSLVAYPASAMIRGELFNMSDPNNHAYSKLLIANQAEVLSIIERENNELTAQLLENGECPEDSCFIEEALSLLNERRDRLLKNWKPEALQVHKIDEESKIKKECGFVEEKMENLEISDSSDASSESLASSSAPTENQNISTNQQSKFYYFYQAADGQHLYLHPINARMLEHTYGSLEQSPATVTGKILEKESGSINEELRKRMKYLQHLPITCQVEMAEIHLQQPVISKETLKNFNEQIEVRKKRRKRRAREEKRREKKIADEENRLLGRYPTPNIHIESQAQFPCFDGRARKDSEYAQLSDGSQSETFITPPNSLSAEQEHAGPSFAKMLASAKKPELPKWPGLKAPASAPAKMINVTGQKIISSCFNRLRNRSDSDPEAEFEPVPPTISLGEAIGQAFQKVEKNDMLHDPGTQLTGKKKKLKNRQKILFTTTLAYKGK